MKRYITLAALLLSASLLAQNNPLEVKEIRLSNGMQVWLNEDHSQPKVYGAVVVKAGAKDCPDTGLAHYLEHLLFKGTEEIGTTDYQAEKVWLDSIAFCYNQLAETPDDSTRLEIQKHINRLSIKASDYAIPNEYDLLIAELGGTGLNAATSYDFTYYFNTFSPQYMAQWAELNSHRLLHPVFRLFQSELETVYEEKNRAADNTMEAPLMEMIREFSGGNAYSYEIIGSTDNLKNPRLGEMMDFFHKYYVGCNMGLILSGDFEPDGIEDLLESTFGRIPEGEKPEKVPVTAPVMDGRRDVKIKAEIPLLKIAVYGFNGPVDGDPDAPALDLATALLTNSFTSGLLDSLTTAHKVMLAAAARVPMFNEMGIVGYAIVPTVPFGSLPKAEKLTREQVEKVKRGQFSDADLNALKLEALRNAEAGIETADSRCNQMVDVMSQGRSWNDYLASVEAIRSVTREDVIRVANKYFSDNYIRFEKVMGSYDKDKVSAPGFDPIIPKNAGARSDYARRLEEMPAADIPPRLLDFSSDVTRIPVCEGVTLVYKENPVNDIFSFSLNVDEGEAEDALIPHVSSYVNTIGTDSLTVQQLSKAWQKLGTSFFCSSQRHSFSLGMGGFDKNFEASLKLLEHISGHLKKDNNAFKELVTAIDVEKKTFLTGGTGNIMQASMQKVFYGDKAPLIQGLSAAELKKAGSKGLLDKFNELMGSECTVFYCGKLPAEEVAAAVRRHLGTPRTRKVQPEFSAYCSYDEPTVFFYDLPGSRQAQIMTYQTPEAPVSGPDKAAFDMLGEYVGGGMFSLMFQEVREFRSMAYSARGSAVRPYPIEKDTRAAFYTSLGTQSDKALDAIQLVDSLLTVMPLKSAGLTASERAIVAKASNGYPDFRSIAETIHSYETYGYKEDPDKEILDNLGSVTADALKAYYEANVRTAPLHHIIVGDRKALPMDEIAKLGKIVELKQKDIYK
ncbi:MAG: insulinase family protein [Bacteroidales bacterium]|nr:insulinase family protein [Bacteroidales bacterium]